MSPPTARTRVVGVIGDPVRHSLSPTLHNAAFAALGVDWVSVAYPVAAGATATALAGMRALGIDGLSVTMPHKAAAADACDTLGDAAAALRSVNCVSRLDDGRLRGDSTDGEGFVRALREVGFEPAGRAALVLGAGGAARAVARALVEAGATVTLAARRPAAASRAAAQATVEAASWAERDDRAATATLVVNATPIGMGDDPDLPIDPGALDPRHTVADLVYHPRRTPLLVAAEARGARTVDGLGMLVHQAGLQLARWTGREAPIGAMRAALETALG